VIRYIHGRRYAGVSLSALRAKFSGVSREILFALLVRWRYAWEHRWGVPDSLSWTVPGQVWSADYTESDFPIDGGVRYILVVRDLGSGFTLAAVPAKSESAAVYVETLTRLFLWLGAPLVLKTDNGSAFRAKVSRKLLIRNGVVHLLSPARRPRYNGAIEAAIGSLKRRIMEVAFRQGDPFRWTSTSLREAVLLGNVRPKWNARDVCPLDLFSTRTAISRGQRAAFIGLVRRHRAEERLRRLLLPAARPNKNTRAAIVRQSIRRALEASGILVVKRRRISPEISP
jgi:transposase InsO family protein